MARRNASIRFRFRNWLLHLYGRLQIAHAHPALVAGEDIEDLESHRIGQQPERFGEIDRVVGPQPSVGAALAATFPTRSGIRKRSGHSRRGRRIMDGSLVRLWDPRGRNAH